MRYSVENTDELLRANLRDGAYRYPKAAPDEARLLLFKSNYVYSLGIMIHNRK